MKRLHFAKNTHPTYYEKYIKFLGIVFSDSEFSGPIIWMCYTQIREQHEVSQLETVDHGQVVKYPGDNR